MGFVVNIRFNSFRPLAIEVEPWWVVKRLKLELERVHKVPSDEIRVIFQGRELHDAVSLQECDLSDFSVLHVVRGARRYRTHAENTTSCVTSRVVSHGASADATLSLEARTQSEGLNQLVEPLAEQTQASIPTVYRSQFYVYCKSQCEAVKPGKLRVRCATCKQGTLTVDSDPCGWEDVLHPGRVTGACQAEGCQGSVAEFYFKCSSHQSSEADTAVALDRIRSNTRGVPCITCMDIENPVLVFPCENAHAMCLECFRLYCTTNLNDRAFSQNADHGYTLPCPAGCPDSLIQEAHHFRILGDQQYERYQRFSAEECLLQMGGVLCPGRDCGMGLLPDPGFKQIVCLQGCGLMFCKDCSEPYHEGDCETAVMRTPSTDNAYRVDPRNAERARWDQESKDTIRETTKPCPSCHVPVEKDGGCMHMLCPRCSYSWCWQCSTEWNRDCQGDHWFG